VPLPDLFNAAVARKGSATRPRGPGEPCPRSHHSGRLSPFSTSSTIGAVVSGGASAYANKNSRWDARGEGRGVAYSRRAASIDPDSRPPTRPGTDAIPPAAVVVARARTPPPALGPRPALAPSPNGLFGGGDVGGSGQAGFASAIRQLLPAEVHATLPRRSDSLGHYMSLIIRDREYSLQQAEQTIRANLFGIYEPTPSDFFKVLPHLPGTREPVHARFYT
jgi:hypothetical protein